MGGERLARLSKNSLRDRRLCDFEASAPNDDIGLAPFAISGHQAVTFDARYAGKNLHLGLRQRFIPGVGLQNAFATQREIRRHLLSQGRVFDATCDIF